MKKKILILTSLFTGKSLGGTDRHTLELSKILSTQYDISICTTNSSDYITWRGDLIEGESQIDNIKILRFKIEKQRNIKKFNRLYTNLIKKNYISKEEGINFITQQGPVVNKLIKYVEQNSMYYDIILFIGYMYFPTINSIPLVKEKAVIIPALHDEPVAYFPIYKDILTDDITYAFNTIEELDLFYKIFNFIPKKNNIVGINISNNIKENELNRFHNINYKYIIYIGRIDEGKGILDLINYFKNWKIKNNSDIKLILAGTGINNYNSEIDIIFTGIINEKEKQFLIQNSILVINPSPMESFSILVMEAWMNEKAVLVNSKSETLKNHCLRSNAGLYFNDSESFEKCLNFILSNTPLLQKMGTNGRRYVEINYSPDIILEKFNHLFSTHILSQQV